MRFVIFTHSLVSDWNHGNAHFLRGFARLARLMTIYGRLKFHFALTAR